jgi:hypothetical protein
VKGKQTPGPFTVCRDGQKQPVIVGAGQTPSKSLIQQGLARPHEVMLPLVARVISGANADADAALLAASDELLAACKAALKWIAGNTPMADSSDPVFGGIADEADAIRATLRDAVRKAEGGGA